MGHPPGWARAAHANRAPGRTLTTQQVEWSTKMKDLEVRPAGPKGRGVFARVPIAAGRPVIAMTGRVLASHELTDDLLAMQVGPDEWLCSDGSSVDDMINHYRDPNLGFSRGDWALLALRDIVDGEELTWDYSTSIAEAGWHLDCRCGTAGCRGVVRSWGELTAVDRDRLRPFAL